MAPCRWTKGSQTLRQRLEKMGGGQLFCSEISFFPIITGTLFIETLIKLGQRCREINNQSFALKRNFRWLIAYIVHIPSIFYDYKSLLFVKELNNIDCIEVNIEASVIHGEMFSWNCQVSLAISTCNMVVFMKRFWVCIARQFHEK